MKLASPIYFPEEDRREILNAVDEVLRSGQLTLGRYGESFEAQFVKQVGVEYAIAVSSGTSALEIIFRSLDVTGKEVVVPSNTFFATAAAVLHAGGRVRFADIDPETLCLDARRLEAAITPQTAGVVVVHIGGGVAPDIEAIVTLCRSKGLWLVEDAAHAHGASFNGRPAGSFGLAAAFSFYPTKVMTCGEGGMIATRDRRIYEEARIYRDQGKANFYSNVHVRLGSNWRMSELHAILGLRQLERLNEFVEARRKVAKIYGQVLQPEGLYRPLDEPSGSYSNFYKYVVLLDRGIDRAELKRGLRERYGVALSGEVYEVPCHKQPVFEALAREGLPDSEAVCAGHVCLPISARMTVEETEYVAKSFRKAIETKGA